VLADIQQHVVQIKEQCGWFPEQPPKHKCTITKWFLIN